MASDDGLKIGISQCLLGEQVRYDGGHKRNSLIVDLLGQVFSWVPVCPEVEAGLGVPREPVELHAGESATRMVGVETGADHTDALNRFTVRKLEDLDGLSLRGFILKSGSPSCGRQVEVEGAEPEPGLFARAIAERFPALPTAEETELADPFARQNFVERVFAYDRQQKFFTSQRSVGQLVMSHAQVKLQLDAHRPGLHAEVAGTFKEAKDLSYEELGERYLAAMMAGPQGPRHRVRALQRSQDCFRGSQKRRRSGRSKGTGPIPAGLPPGQRPPRGAALAAAALRAGSSEPALQPADLPGARAQRAAAETAGLVTSA